VPDYKDAGLKPEEAWEAHVEGMIKDGLISANHKIEKQTKKSINIMWNIGLTQNNHE